VISRLIVIIGFGALALLPLIQRITGLLPDAPLAENRIQVPAPQWDKVLLKDYLLGWQSWYNDRYAGRNFLIRLKTQIDYTVFSYSDRVYVGHHGWLFYRSVIDVEKPAVERMTDANFGQIVQNIKNLNDWLAHRGIRLIVMDNELKDSFYPEELPRSAPEHSRITHYQHFRERIGAETGAEYVDASQILMTLKPVRPIFHRTDFHWNDPAAFEVARVLVNRMAALVEPGKTGWRWKLAIETRELSGGEAAFMPLLHPVTEQALFVRPTWPTPQREYRQNDGPFEFSLRHPGNPDLLPGVVVFGDSFFDGLIRSGFDEHFKSVHRARFYKTTVGDTLRALPPDTKFFVLQFIETSAIGLTVPFNLPPLPAEDRHTLP